MRIQLIVLALLLLLCHSRTTWSNTLCKDCAVNISTSLCTKCLSTGCAAYTNFDSTTSQCSCKAGYYMNNDNSNAIYCDRCFIGCATCTGPLATQCLTCSPNFILNSNTTTCAPPLTASDYTIQQAYYFLGFNAVSGWSPTGVTTCSSTTLLGLTTSTYSVTFISLKSHFAVRVMFAHYLSASGVISTNIQIGYDGTVTNVPISVNTTNSNNPSLSCSGVPTNFIQTYVDSSATHTNTANVTITITTSSYSFGIRELYVILKLCDGVCTSCTGYNSSTCTGCADPNRLANVTTNVNNFTGSCVCVGGYYQEPTAGACVEICPSFPVETFGDNSSRSCVTNCPSNSYAYTDSYLCVSDCPTTSVSGTLLFKDNLYWRCVTNCPAEAPYACQNTSYRTCYANCPNTTNTANQTFDFFAVNGISPQCVSVCPNNSTFSLFGYNGLCIPRCPNGTWGDPGSKLCVSNCTNTTYLYKDSSSGSYLCVFTCSSLNYFRDNSTYTCVTTCPSTLFGETTRECVSRCANGSFGLPFGNRKCVMYCPDGWWGQPDTNVCVNTTFQCKTNTTNATNGYYRYADNFTRTCVYPWECSLGYFADNLTQNCVPQCPSSPTPVNTTSSSVGYINSVCQVTCQSPYFADYVAGLCVLHCLTNNTYADASSTRTCVTSCNSSGLTPWADNTTWTCVSVCNSTGVAEFVSDNSTFTCVYNCPPGSYADRITTNNPTCRLTCPNGTYADNSTGTGICSLGCSAYPTRFGDPTGYLNLCVPICSAPLFGDTTGYRLCVSVCPTNFFSQNDTTRQCVGRCNPGSYGSNFSCLLNPQDCPAGTFANDATNLCDICNATLGTWGDPVSKRCVTVCPLNPVYNSSNPTAAPKFTYADVSIQQCVTICNSTYVNTPYTGLFGNNNTRSCMGKCSDLNAFAKIPSAGGFRLCVARCYPFDYFANNQTKVCVTSINCPSNQFGENSTQTCVAACPTGSWAYATTSDRICIDICPTTWFADNSTSLNICVQNCPSIPSLFADSTTKKCVAQCPISAGITYYADSTTQKCVTSCPTTYYAYTLNRTCLAVCPSGYFGLNTTISGVIVGKCVSPSSACGSGLVGDPYLNLCVSLCTGPTPVSLFAYNFDCLATCPTTYYSNTYNGVRDCVQLCPPGVIDSVSAPNLYGDNQTRSCVPSCVTPLRWADPHTRLCQAVCSSNPPLYSQNFFYTCVAAISCPTSPSMTFGDNVTRSCVSNCSNGTFGDPVSRACLTQCQNILVTGTSTYYSDTSTGIYLCVVVCPILPSLFGFNNTNTCVSECPQPLYGDQTGNRSCVAVCPIIGSVTYFAQNLSRICVTVCVSGTWGKITTSAQECVETAGNCTAQWADNSTNLCVDVCPESMDTYADPTTKFCVPLCPNYPNLYFSDYTTRTCVQTCPAGVEEHGTFGNNETRTCEQSCSPFSNGTIITFADPQTGNRYCVLKCSQNPNTSFADSSTRTCVPICPTSPDLYGQTTNFTCVNTCTNNTYADTITRLCVSSCQTGQFKLTTPVNQCVSVCPADQEVPLYGDNSTGFCVASCGNNTFRYKTLSICVASCTDYGDFVFNMTCVEYCPSGYYANSSGICVPTCPGSTFGENSTTTCVGTCLTGFAYNNLCIAICPLGYYGENYICATSCQVAGNTASNVTRTCISNCTNGTYAQNGGCVANCTSGTFADPLTNICSNGCSSALYYGSPLTNSCVQQCPPGYYISSGKCSTTCTGSYFADNITWSCTLNCSTGYWGYNNLCLTVCPSNFYAYTVDRICYSTSTFPTTIAMFADNVTQTWVSMCPLNPLAFGDTTTRYCISSCLGSNLADPSTNKCETSCQNSSYFADYVGKQCVLVCPGGYFANSVNNQCQSICTTGYAYNLERTCTSTCPNPYSGYYNGSAKICVLRCPTNTYSFGRVCGPTCSSPYYADNTTNQCVLSCVNSFASNDSWICVPSCASFTTYTVADNSTNQCVSICPSSPDYYAQNNICVKYCAPSTYADPTPGVRICTSLCTDGLFSNPLSGRCEATCPNNYWGQSLNVNLNRCQSVCSIGFADNSTGLCQFTCPSPTYADPTTARCVKICPNGYFGEVNNTCVQKCTLYNYANPLTRTCTPTCPSFNYLFAENTTASCVANCSIVSNSYADRNINACVQNCTLDNEYMLDGQAICTSLCPSGLFMQNSTKKCQSQCTTGFAEPTSRYCVTRCFGDPQTYGYLGVCYYSCPTNSNTYADNSSSLCVNPCPVAYNYFSDPLTGNCVKWCPDGYFSETSGRTCSPTCTTGFADNLTRSCVSDCPTAVTQTYGDTVAHTCVRICPPGTYADNSTLRCVHPCPNNTWADDISKYCVARCPSEPLTFGLNSSTTCVSRCPSGFYGDFESQTCVSSCPIANNSQYRFADPVSQICVFVCPINASLYGDTSITSNFSCVSNCYGSQLRDNSTQRCVPVCPSQPSYWADTVSHNCVYYCPPSYFASNQTDRLCVQNCTAYLTFGDKNSQICAHVCPYNYWADNSTYLCVDKCPSSPDYYADNTTQSCVFYCPKSVNWTTFADSQSRRCVTECPNGYFGVNATQRCQQYCPNGTYADPIIRVCVADCTVRPHYYKTSTWTCVFECPTISVISYKLNTNNTCVYTDSSGNTGCPSTYWADPTNNTCTQLCPDTYFADQVKQICVKQCPAGKFADKVDRLCKSGCSLTPQEYRLDQTPGTCVQFCPDPLYADNSTYYCVSRCPSTPQVMYSYNITRTCVLNCPPPYYAYANDNACRLDCTGLFFAQDSTRSCELICQPPYYADDSTNRCVLMCPSNPNYYGFNSTCLRSCPNGTYADNSTRLCVSNCTTQPQTFADNSTNMCVAVCPSTPNFFADNTTMTCVYNCSSNLFAEVTTRTCVVNCPSDLMTYADPTTGFCQPSCVYPYFASDLTKECVTLCPNTPVKTYARTNGRVCVTKCPGGTYAENISRTCAADCTLGGNNSNVRPTAYADINSNVCVSTCPYGWFGNNDTLACTQQCPYNTYADNNTRMCLAVCPGTARLYADISTSKCVSTCPSLTYGNTVNWTCITSCPPSVFGYQLDLGNLCIPECPAPYFAYTTGRKCVTDCGAGYFGSSATRICSSCPSTCPTCVSLNQCLSCTAGLYLSFGICTNICPSGTYANNASMTCVYAVSCPSGTFGNNQTSSCSAVCPTKQFADAMTKMCLNCPQTCESCLSTSVCLTCITNAAFSSQTKQCYAFCNPSAIYSYNGTCFSSCPNGTYLDYTNINCQSCNSICSTCSFSATNCTSCSSTYLYNFTCISQCPTNMYGSNGTCLPCTSSVPSCSKPLTFTVTTSTQNYQTVVYLTFNQQTQIQGKPQDFLSLNLKPTRLLQGGLVNNGLQYTSEVLPDGTIKLTLAPGVTLTNPSFTVSITNPSMITTSSGQTLQSLTADLNNVPLNNFPAGSTSDSPMIVAGTVLSVFMLILLACVFICTPLPTFLTFEAFQMIAFYALVVELPPNLFYFMQQLSLSRLSFLPNIFAGVYKPPSGYSSSIPSKMVDLDGYFGFSMSAGSYFFVLLVYAFISLIIYGLSSKYNSNRPLRQLFTKIYHIRVKWGILNDFLWLFSLNVFVCGFMQFRYTDNAGDVVLTVFSLLVLLGLPIALFVHHLKTYDSEDEEIANNYRFIHEGLSDGTVYRNTIFVYYLRKVLFAIVIASTIGGPAKAQCIALIIISSLMLVFLVVVRPYQDKLRNIIHILHEIGLTFLGGAMLYYQHYVEILEPVGTKIICGTIITIVIIAHLSIALIWGYFKAYNFYKKLFKDFKETEFFQLYLDEKYDETLEKELRDLNDETGEIQSVQLTNVAENELHEEENIIKLKIKRRRKINKAAEVVESKVPRNQGEYVRIEQTMENQSIVHIENTISPQKFQRMNFEEIVDHPMIVPDLKSEVSWEEINGNKSQRQKTENIFEAVNDHEMSELNPRELNFAEMDHLQPPARSALEMQQISSVSNKEERISKQEGDDHLRESLKQMDENIIKEPMEQQIYEQEELQIQNEPQPQYEALPQPSQQSEMQSDHHQPIPPFQEQQKEQVREAINNLPQMNELNHQQQASNNDDEWQQMSDLTSKKDEKMSNFIINLDLEQSVQPVEEQIKPKEGPSQNANWNIEIEQLLVQEQKKQNDKKRHLLLFDDQDFQ